MFTGCTSLESIDLSRLDTHMVEDMSCMFSDCTNLRQIDLKNFDTSHANDLACMFYNCTSIEELDFSKFSNSSDKGIIWAKNIFGGCSSLKSVKLPEDDAAASIIQYQLSLAGYVTW